MIPSGWLIDPKTKYLLLFHREQFSVNCVPQILMDKWDSTSQGTPASFKNSRKVDLQAAIETWTELIGNGWRHVKF